MEEKKGILVHQLREEHRESILVIEIMYRGGEKEGGKRKGEKNERERKKERYKD